MDSAAVGRAQSRTRLPASGCGAVTDNISRTPSGTVAKLLVELKLAPGVELTGAEVPLLDKGLLHEPPLK